MSKRNEPLLAYTIVNWLRKNVLSLSVSGYLVFLAFSALIAFVPIILTMSKPSCDTRIEKEVYSPNFSLGEVGYSAREMGDYCSFGDYTFRIEVVRFVNGKESQKTEIYKDFTNTFPATFSWLSSRELRVCSKVNISEKVGTVKENLQWNEVKITKRLNISSETKFYKECHSK